MAYHLHTQQKFSPSAWAETKMFIQCKIVFLEAAGMKSHSTFYERTLYICASEYFKFVFWETLWEFVNAHRGREANASVDTWFLETLSLTLVGLNINFQCQFTATVTRDGIPQTAGLKSQSPFENATYNFMLQNILMLTSWKLLFVTMFWQVHPLNIHNWQTRLGYE